MAYETLFMDFTKFDGLIPAVIQDDVSNEVLMVGFMNQEALDRTVATGFATFFSRTRGKAVDEGRDVRATACASSGSSSIATRTRCSCGSRGWVTGTSATRAIEPVLAVATMSDVEGSVCITQRSRGPTPRSLSRGDFAPRSGRRRFSMQLKQTCPTS